MNEEESVDMEINESENSDSDSSDESNENEEKELLDKVKELENVISNNKYSYNAHLEIVELYRKLGDLNSLRASYERFHECFPLTPQIWLGWLKDEIKLANVQSEQTKLFQLFDQAVEDYIAVDIWIEYAQYSIGVSNLDTTRSILERGLTAAGLHCTEGCLLWDTLRELEHAHISLHPENSDEWKKQVQRLNDIFKRQLSVPLINMESTYSEWDDWVKNIPNDLIDRKSVDYGYNKALKLLETFTPFEERLLIAESNEEYYDIFKEYIKSATDPSTIICLYERAALKLCLVPDVWMDFIRYTLKLGDAALKVSQRALRNCPWSEELWVIRLRVLEKFSASENEILLCFEEGLTAISPNPGLELWLAYLDYNHRNTQSQEKMDKICNQAIQQLGFENDPASKANRFYARILAKRSDMKAARKVWGGILSNPQNKATANVWMEYAALEREYGEPQALRNLFQKAINSCHDWPQFIAEEWLMYERQFGTLDDILKCIDKCKQTLKSTYDDTSNYQSEKRQEKQTDKVSKDHFNMAQGKKRKFEDSKGQKSKNETRDFDNKRFKEHRETKQSTSKQSVDAKKPQNIIDKNPKTTVFLSNLYPSVEEETISKFFPNAVNIEIVRDRNGKSRCFGYVQFEGEEQVMVALARDREPIDGRPLFISEIKPDKNERKPVFKYATNVEKNKLFVRGLPIKKSKEELADLFKKYGANDVRLVLHKSGQPKGLAYVEFENEEAAENALKQMDQMKIDDHVITVAISAPPPKGGKPQAYNSSRTFEEPLRHARSRLQVPLIPRTLQVKTEKKKNTSNGSVKPKSNADFRSMLLKK